MEATQNAFAAAQQKKQRRKRIRNLCILLAVIAVVAVAAIVLIPMLTAEDPSASVLTYQVGAVTEGETNTSVSGSGTLTAKNAASFTAPADAEIQEVFKQAGDRVSAGETLLTLTSDMLDEELAALKDELATLRDSLASASQEARSLYITAARAGVVKQLSAAAGDIVEDAGVLCVISTDGRMKLTIDAPDTMKRYDVVSVVIGSKSVDGLVTGLSGGKATVIIADNTYDIGAAADIYNTDGALLGSGALELNEYISVTGDAGRISSVLVQENSSVSRGGRLFLLEDGAPNSSYLALKEQEAELLEKIEDCKAKYAVTAEWDGIVTTMSVASGDDVLSGDALCTLAGADGYTMSISVDELDISSVRIGQDVTLTMDAIDGTFAGVVSNISYEGSGSYVTSYSASLAIDPIDSALPGMSVSAKVITESSGQALIVPVDAVQYKNGEAYLYLADDSASLGTVYAEAEIDTGALNRVAVETGMSDGSYIVVTGELHAGALILIPVRTTTSTYNSGSNSYNGMMITGGGFGFDGMGGTMPSFSGDFSGGTMPSGGFGGNGSSNRGSRSGE